jgi:hypothetical protein
MVSSTLFASTSTRTNFLQGAKFSTVTFTRLAFPFNAEPVQWGGCSAETPLSESETVENQVAGVKRVKRIVDGSFGLLQRQIGQGRVAPG